MNNPLVSIVIPSYNHERFIADTIKSVMDQSYNNIELIVIDDGSTDNSREVIKKCQRNYNNNFEFIEKKNEGLVKTLNYGLSLIKGKYYQVLGSDDIIYKEKIELQVNHLESNADDAMVYSDCDRFYQNLNVKAKASQDYKFSGGYIFKEIYTSYFSIPTLTVLVRSEIIKKIGYLNEFKVEDFVLWNTISYSYKIGFIPSSLAMYRIHNNNMHKNFRLTKNEKINVINYIKIKFEIEDNLYSLACNNNNFKQARNYNRGIIYCKKEFIKGLYAKLNNSMSITINYKDVLKFIFKWF